MSVAENKGLLEKVNTKNEVSKSPQQTLRDNINKMIPELKRAMPNIGITADRMARLALTALNTNPKLYDCEPNSFMAALVQTAQLGLEPNTPLGQAYLIPYGGKVQYQIGYLGIIELAYRSEKYSTIYAKEVYENDEFSFEYGLNSNLIHKPAKDSKGEPIYFYAIYKLKNGGYGFEVMSKEQIDMHAQKFSQAVQKGWTSPWKTNYIQMALKTVIKKLLKYAPKSTELAHVIQTDETVQTISEDMTTIITNYETQTGEIIENKKEGE